ncbi:MAG: aminotransferase class I/II-fold pyridoxal phosphate-dependent enzyme [Bacteroidales bacterium]|jgi:histidinol-phosphate/aromatic aminotransferase/cobyric acid decarboxylase-like protein/choline kinase|nr:aminotransferase class I/II-fold pyridoxal phosphate-dependent enzyme [Bacteroidales bacterium]
MQAIILAAGMGKRLKDLTKDRTKCMVKVNGVTLIERMLRQIDALNTSKIVVVVGYHGQELIDFISSLHIKTPIEFIDNKIYDKTNNIYSLYMAKNDLLSDDTLLFESDLIFEDSVLQRIVNDPHPNLTLVSKYESWMDGTVVTIDDDNNITSFLGKNNFNFNHISEYYKTVNIYKFSKAFSNTHYVPFLEAYSKALGNNEYYEQVLKVITPLDKPEIKALPLDNEKWYEIDDIQDLDIAESIFTQSNSEKLQRIQKRYGGYWRYPQLIDFCYLVNPYFPPQKLMDEIKVNFEQLLTEYPSGMDVNSLLIAKYFDMDIKHVCVGNGAAEIIKSITGKLNGKFGIVIPTFEEYPNRLTKEDIIHYKPQNADYKYGADELIEFFSKSDNQISNLVLINPDNPSGNFLDKNDVLKLVEWTKAKNMNIILDESFIDFAESSKSESLLLREIIQKYSNLILIKSISKSFGVPGLRLGFAASSNTDLIQFMKKDLSIWNINSFAEFYLQIAEKYRSDYWSAIERFKTERQLFIDKLSQLEIIRPIETQSNYFLCEVFGSAQELTEKLLSNYNVFIKDLSSKKGFEGKEYIRISIKTQEENNKLIDALKHIQEAAHK